MTLSVLLLIAALVCFLAAAIGIGSRVNLVAAGLACWVASVLLGGAHVAIGMAGPMQASLVPMGAVAGPGIDPQTYNLVVALAVGAASSYLLKWAPASWKGKPMVIIAILASAGIELVELYITGQLAHFNWGDATAIAAAIAGQQGFFAMFNDDLHLADPPTPPPAPKPSP